MKSYWQILGSLFLYTLAIASLTAMLITHERYYILLYGLFMFMSIFALGKPSGGSK